MTSKITRTGSGPPPPKNVGKLHNLTRNTKIWQPTENRTLPNFKPPKMGEACLPTYLTFDMCPRVLWPSRVCISTLIGIIFDFRGILCQNQSYKPVSVYLLHIPILHYLAEIALHVQGSLKEQFWTLLGSLKASGSLEVLGSP